MADIRRGLTTTERHLIVSEVEKRVFLWDRRNLNYQDKRLKAEAFAEIGRLLTPPVTGEDIKAAWYSLRSQYCTRDSKQRKTGRETATKWEFWEPMKFLWPTLAVAARGGMTFLGVKNENGSTDQVSAYFEENPTNYDEELDLLGEGVHGGMDACASAIQVSTIDVSEGEHWSEVDDGFFQLSPAISSEKLVSDIIQDTEEHVQEQKQENALNSREVEPSTSSANSQNEGPDRKRSRISAPLAVAVTSHASWGSAPTSLSPGLTERAQPMKLLQSPDRSYQKQEVVIIRPPAGNPSYASRDPSYTSRDPSYTSRDPTSAFVKALKDIDAAKADPEVLFCASLSAQLKKLSEVAKSKAMAKIQAVVSEVQLEELAMVVLS